jgi:ssDNA-binding Zn-finger/Zn-ribbon topoisomerase 1
MCADLFDGIEPGKLEPEKKSGKAGHGDQDVTTAAPGVAHGAAAAANSQRVVYCPRCRNPMRRIIGKMGPFWGCTTYPACDKKLYDLDGQPSDTPDERYRCPVCTRPLVRAEAKASVDTAADESNTHSTRGDYWYCTGYNKGCKVTLDDYAGKPADAWRCPRCAHLLKQRRGKNGVFWGCSQYPLCTASFADVDGKPKGPGFE